MSELPVRQPAVAGQFYPTTPDAVRHMIQDYVDSATLPEELGIVRAPLGLRRIEAALIRDGFDPADVAVVRPEDLHRAIGPATRLVGAACFGRVIA